MHLTIRKLFFILALNFSMFLLIMIATQNSLEKRKVNFILGETISLPTGFIMGVSFISGSIASSILTFKSHNKEKKIKNLL